MNIFGTGGLEIVVILAIAFILFGPARTVAMSRKAAKVIGDLRRITSDLPGGRF